MRFCFIRACVLLMFFGVVIRYDIEQTIWISIDISIWWFLYVFLFFFNFSNILKQLLSWFFFLAYFLWRVLTTLLTFKCLRTFFLLLKHLLRLPNIKWIVIVFIYIYTSSLSLKLLCFTMLVVSSVTLLSPLVFSVKLILIILTAFLITFNLNICSLSFLLSVSQWCWLRICPIIVKKVFWVS